MTVRVTTAPAYEPVSLAQFKEWARIDDDTQDAICEMLIQAMREYAENLTGRAFIPRTLQLVLPDWQCGFIELPQAPLIDVTSITYIDVNGAEQTLAADQYVVHTEREPGVIVPAWQVTWPAYRFVMDAIRVNYQAGYAAVGSPVDEQAYQDGLPAKLKLWVHARAATLNENREQLMPANQVVIPRHFADGLLDSLILGGRLW